jgi:hypothetical protein
MKIKDVVLVIVLIALATLVCGYGHSLCEANFLKWICVLVWALFIGSLAFAAIDPINNK